MMLIDQNKCGLTFIFQPNDGGESPLVMLVMDLIQDQVGINCTGWVGDYSSGRWNSNDDFYSKKKRNDI